VSVGLVIGLGVWGYKILVRDVSGVPVIRAAQGPMRIQPDDPGGRQALNQGLSVNDVAAKGTARAAPDELILAPAPLELSDEDAPGAPEAPRAQEARSQAPEPAVGKVAQASEVGPPTSDAATDEMLALAEVLSEGIAPMAALDDAPNVGLPGAEEEEIADGLEEAPPPSGSIATSLRPRARPADLSNIQQVAAAAPGTGTRDIDPDSIATGTRLAQLGAFASEDIARAEWGRLGTRFEEYLNDKDRVIQRATSGGRTFYRLRAMGFDDLADARRFCSALVAEKAECIPVVTR
jgi:hypothetical protein